MHDSTSFFVGSGFENHTTIKPQVHINVHPVNQFFGDDVTVTATTIGSGAISYRWLRNGAVLSTAEYPACDGLGTNKLTISPFTHDYEGKYQCSVRFSGGKVVKSSHIVLVLSKLRL